MNRERLVSLIIVLAVVAITTYVGWDQPGGYYAGWEYPWGYRIPPGGISLGIATLIGFLFPLSLIWFGNRFPSTNRPRSAPPLDFDTLDPVFPETESTGIIYRLLGWVILLVFAFLRLFLLLYK